MKNIYKFIIIITFLIFSLKLLSASIKDDIGITFEFSNSSITTKEQQRYFEFDIMVHASENSTKIGANQIYVNYSTEGFGQRIIENDNITIEKGTLMQGDIGGFTKYIIVNKVDNTDSCFSVAIHYDFEMNPNLGNDLPTEPTQLLHISILIENADANAGLSYKDYLMVGQQYQSDNATKYDPVTALDIDNSSLSVAIDDEPSSKLHFLTANPNPFSIYKNEVRIEFAIDQNNIAELKIYNIKGQLVKTLFHEPVKKFEPKTIIWNGKDNNENIVAPGIYLCKLTVNNKLYKTTKIVIIR